MRVLVTGATGFIGACLARRILRDGHEVHIFTRESSDRWRLADVRSELHEHAVDLRDRMRVSAVVDAIGPEIIYHCATFGGFAEQQDAHTIIESNFLGTVNLFRACERTGFAYFVNTGSSSEYGIKTGPMREGDAPEPTDDYGVSKTAATLFCCKEGKAKSLPVVTLRLFSPYGPWDDPRRLIPYVIKCFLRGEAPLLSTPASVRDYVYIDDILTAYLNVIRTPFFGEIFNIGSGTQRSIGNVVTAVQHIIRPTKAPQWGSVGRKRTEPESWVADVAKAKRMFNWSPETSLEAGLEQTVTRIKAHLDRYP